MALTIKESNNLLESQSFATHQLYVTKHKDTEVYASHSNNAYDPGSESILLLFEVTLPFATRSLTPVLGAAPDPIIRFDDYFNGESLVQEDIVLWVNLGMHHVPHTGDLPNTVMTTAQSGFMLLPHNYLLNDPSRASRQAVKITYNTTAVEAVDRFGGTDPSGTVELVRRRGPSRFLSSVLFSLPFASHPCFCSLSPLFPPTPLITCLRVKLTFSPCSSLPIPCLFLGGPQRQPLGLLWSVFLPAHCLPLPALLSSSNLPCS